MADHCTSPVERTVTETVSWLIDETVAKDDASAPPVAPPPPPPPPLTDCPSTSQSCEILSGGAGRMGSMADSAYLVGGVARRPWPGGIVPAGSSWSSPSAIRDIRHVSLVGAEGSADTAAWRDRLSSLHHQLNMLSDRNDKLSAKYTNALKDLEHNCALRKRLENDLKAAVDGQTQMRAHHEIAVQLLDQQLIDCKLKLEYKAEEVKHLKEQLPPLGGSEAASGGDGAYGEFLLKQWEDARQENAQLHRQLDAKLEESRELRLKLEYREDSYRKSTMALYEQLHKMAQERDQAIARLDVAQQDYETARIESTRLLSQRHQLEDAQRVAEQRYEQLSREYRRIMSERDVVLCENSELAEERDRLADDAKALLAERADLAERLVAARANLQGAQKERDALARRLEEIGELGSARELYSMTSSESEVAEITRSAIEKELSDLRSKTKLMDQTINSNRIELEGARERRDWALEERRRTVAERESMRVMCDQLRRERDDAIGRLADAIRDSDNVHRQRDSADMKESVDVRCAERESGGAAESSSPSHSRDSAIDNDMAEWEIETLEFNMSGVNGDLGLELRGGRDDLICGTAVPIFVKSVDHNSRFAGVLRIFDSIIQVNGIEVQNMEHRSVTDILQNSKNVKMVIKRRRLVGMKLISVPLNTDSGSDVGMQFEDGVYIGKIRTSSAAARAGNLAVGDRLVYVNDVPVAGKSAADVKELVASLRGGGIALAVVKSPPVLSPITPSTSAAFCAFPSAARVACEKTVQTDSPPVADAAALSAVDARFGHAPNKSRHNLLDKVHDKIFGKMEKKRSVVATASIPIYSTVDADKVAGATRHTTSAATVHSGSSGRGWLARGVPRDGYSSFSSSTAASGPISPNEQEVLEQFDMILMGGADDASISSTKHIASRARTSADDKESGSTWPKLRPNTAIPPPPSVTSNRPRIVPVRPSVIPVFETAPSEPPVAAPSRHVQPTTPSPRGRPVSYHPQTVSMRSAVWSPNKRPASLLRPQKAASTYGSVGSGGQSAEFVAAERPMLVHATPVVVSRAPVVERQPPPPPYPGSPSSRATPDYCSRSDYDTVAYSSSGVSHSSQSSASISMSFPRHHSSQSLAGRAATPQGRYKSSTTPRAQPRTDRFSPFKPLNFDYQHCNPGEIRELCIEKRNSCDTLGIQVDSRGSGVFISNVNTHSLAQQRGIHVGDQLLDVCGINMRNADLQLAKKVLQQISRSDQVFLTVQYNPQRYNEQLVRGGVSASSTPRATPVSFAPHTRPSVSSLHTPAHSREVLESISEADLPCEPRFVVVARKEAPGMANCWRFALTGGYPIGIFVKDLASDHNSWPKNGHGGDGLRPGDQILEFNGIDMRKLTLEQAQFELERSFDGDEVALLVQCNELKFEQCKTRGTGDSFYIRVNVDRTASNPDELSLKCGDILYVDNTVFMGKSGSWRAWRLDEEGRGQSCGIIPSKYKLEEEFVLRRTGSEMSAEGGSSEGGGSRRATIRRSLKFMRRSSRSSQHQRTSSKDSARDPDSDQLTLVDDLYQRVERLDYKRKRPVILFGAVVQPFVAQLAQQHSRLFRPCVPECVTLAPQQLDERMRNDVYVDCHKLDQLFRVTPMATLRQLIDQGAHPVLFDVQPRAIDCLLRQHIYPIVVFVKLKSAKQIKEVSEHASNRAERRVSSRHAKEMLERAAHLETQLSGINCHRATIAATSQSCVDSTVRLVCQQIVAAVEHEQKKTLWIVSADCL